MGEKITRENRKFKFETLQLHVGQEQPGRKWKAGKSIS